MVFMRLIIFRAATMIRVEEMELFRSRDQFTIERAQDKTPDQMSELLKRAEYSRKTWGDESQRSMNDKKDLCMVSCTFNKIRISMIFSLPGIA